MRRLGHYVASAVISLSLIATSTAAAAASESVPVAPSSDGWMALSMLTPSSGAAVVSTSSLAAAQPDTPPPPPPPPGYYSGPGTPPIPVLVVWLIVLATFIYIVTKGNSSSKPNSPA